MSPTLDLLHRLTRVSEGAQHSFAHSRHPLCPLHQNRSPLAFAVTVTCGSHLPDPYSCPSLSAHPLKMPRHLIDLCRRANASHRRIPGSVRPEIQSSVHPVSRCNRCSRRMSHLDTFGEWADRAKLKWPNDIYASSHPRILVKSQNRRNSAEFS